MKFIVTADTQLGLYSKFSEIKDDSLDLRWNSKRFKKFNFKNIKPTSSLNFEVNNFIKLTQKLHDTQYEFVTILGDLINDYNSDFQYDKFQEIICSNIDNTNLHLIPGNHDMNEPPDKTSLDIYRSRFGDDYYIKNYCDLRFVFLNSTLLRNNSLLKNEYQKQDNIIETALKNYSSDLFIFMHHSLFYEDVNEELNPWNIDKYTRLNLIKKLSQHNGKVYLFSGHLHKNRIVKYKNITNITVSSVGVPLGEDPPGYYVVEYAKNILNYNFISIGD